MRACALFNILFLTGSAPDFHSTTILAAFEAAGTGAFASSPCSSSYGWAEARAAHFVALVLTWTWIAAAASDTLLVAEGFDAPTSPACFFLCFPSEIGDWSEEASRQERDSAERLAAPELQEGLTYAMYAWVLDHETILAPQNWLVVAGLLRVWRSARVHEYVVLHSGGCRAGRPEAERKDESLCLLLDHADAGWESAVQLLERPAGRPRRNRALWARNRISRSFFGSSVSAFVGKPS
jgi:hypothetical protein